MFHKEIKFYETLMYNIIQNYLKMFWKLYTYKSIDINLLKVYRNAYLDLAQFKTKSNYNLSKQMNSIKIKCFTDQFVFIKSII